MITSTHASVCATSAAVTTFALLAPQSKVDADQSLPAVGGDATLLDVRSSSIWALLITISEILIYLQYTNAPYLTVLPPRKNGFLVSRTTKFTMI